MMPKPRLGANDHKMTHTLSCLSSMQTPGQPALIIFSVPALLLKSRPDAPLTSLSAPGLPHLPPPAIIRRAAVNHVTLPDGSRRPIRTERQF